VRVVLVALFFVPHLMAAEVPSNSLLRELVNDVKLMEQMANIVDRASGMEMFNAELAAFVLRDESGAFTLLPWGDDRGALGTSYRGVMPPNVFAIVHTHPRGRLLPSVGDLKEAQRLKIPICVLTRQAIWVADPDSVEPLRLLNDATWTRRAKREASIR
jgi:hypothetical protein